MLEYPLSSAAMTDMAKCLLGDKSLSVENFGDILYESIITQVLNVSKLLTMSVNTPGLIRLIIFATWKTSTAFSFSSWWDRVVRAHNIPAETAPYLMEENKRCSYRFHEGLNILE